MRLPLKPTTTLLTLLATFSLPLPTTANPESSPTASATPCVATSASGSFYDLRPDIAGTGAPDSQHHRSSRRAAPAKDYVARGYEYGYNFTLNICGPLLQPVTGVVGVDRELWSGVGAAYELGGKVYSLGQESSELTPRGRKLVLQYSGGSPCGTSTLSNRRTSSSSSNITPSYTYLDDDSPSPTRRKSVTISFLCDRGPMSTAAAASFVAADPDECAYFFEVRSSHACAGVAHDNPGSLGPGSVFGVILVVAVLVYLVGGVVYQRTVAHARGWRQLPNYAMWAGIWGTLRNIFNLFTSSCAQIVPHRRGYRSLAGSPTSWARTRDDENRLIDQLDEEWED